MKRHLLAAGVMLALSQASPIFGQQNTTTKQATVERQQRKMKKEITRFRKETARVAFQGKQEIARRLRNGRGQYPEYLKLRDRNVARGKWAANISR